MIAGDEARRAGAHAVPLNRGGGRRLEGRMVGEVEIIVAGEGQQAAAVALDPWAVPAKTLGKRAPQTGAIELRQFASSKIIQGPHRHLGCWLSLNFCFRS